MLQIREHTRIWSDKTEKLFKTRKGEVAISALYQSFKPLFIDMQSQLESIRSGHVGRITMAKHLIKILHPDTALTHLVPYQTSLKRDEFEKSDTDKMLDKNAIEPAQTKWAAPLKFLFMKNGTLRVHVVYFTLKNY